MDIQSGANSMYASWSDDKYRIRLYHADCFDVFPHLEGTIEAVVSDPPYGVAYEGGHFHSGDVAIQRKTRPLEGDKEDVYSRVMNPLFRLCKGPVYLFYSTSKTLEVFKSIDEANGQVHALIIWHKTNAKYAAMGAQYKNRYEPLVYCKAKGGNLMWCGPSNECTLWEMPRDASNKYHPTQKPVRLMERIIGNHTSDTILDPFMGSGSTGVACVNLGRSFVGIEKDRHHYETAISRITEAILDSQDGPLFATHKPEQLTIENLVDN